MQSVRLIVAVAGIALLSPGIGAAQSSDELAKMTPEQRREHIQSMPEAERKAFVEKRRAEWGAMSEQERQAARERRGANKGQGRGKNKGQRGGQGKKRRDGQHKGQL